MNYVNAEIVTYNPDQVDDEIAKIRLAIGDTTQGNGVRPDSRNFSNGELAVFLELAGSWFGAVPLVVQTLSTEFANAGRRALLASDAETVKTAEQYAKIAAELRQQAVEWQKQSKALADAAAQAAQAEAASAAADAIAYAGTDAGVAFFQLPVKGGV